MVAKIFICTHLILVGNMDLILIQKREVPLFYPSEYESEVQLSVCDSPP